MLRSLPVALGGLAVLFAFASCGTVTQAPDGSGQAGSSAGASGQAGSGQGGGSAGTTGQAGSGAGGATAGTTGQGGSGAGGQAGGGTTGNAGRGGQAGGNAGTTGSGGRGGQAGGATAGTTGGGGRGGQAGGNAGTIGSGGRGGQAGGGAGTTGRGGQGGGTDGGVSCSELESQYSKAVADARMCNPDASGQCQQKVNSGLSCPGCQVAVNSTTQPDAIRTQWTKQGCTPGIVCPAIICVAPGAGMCTKTDASSSGGICTTLPTPVP